MLQWHITTMEEALEMVKLGINMKIWCANAYGAISIMDG